MNFSKDTIIKRKLENLAGLIEPDRLEIPEWQTRHATFLGADGYTEEVADEPMRVGDRWKCRDDFTRWFSADVRVPDSFAGKKTGARARVRRRRHCARERQNHLRDHLLY